MIRAEQTLEKVIGLHAGLTRYRELLRGRQYMEADQLRSSLAITYGEIREDLVQLNVPLFWGTGSRTFPVFESALTPFNPIFASVYSDSIGHALAALEMAQGLLARMLDDTKGVEDNVGQRRAPSKGVFVVHGHDEALTQAVARFIERLGLNALVLEEQPRPSRTIIEQIEKHSDVGFAVVLFTPDDIGYPVGVPERAQARPRQNVVFEAGYFMGLLGRDRVCVLHKGDLEMLSDLQGVLYLPADSDGWKMNLARQLRDVGLDVDLDAVFEG